MIELGFVLVGLVMGLVLRRGREQEAYLRGVAVGRRQGRGFADRRR